MALLDIYGLSVSYGGLRAVSNFDLTVERGRLVGLIGPNGAGKTTFIDGLTGFVHTSGRIVFKDEEINELSVHQRARRGLGRTWQSLELFDDLTVEQNLQVATERQGVRNFFADMVRPGRSRDRSGAEFALDVLGIGDLRDKMPNEISQGQRKLVSVGRALARHPDLVCMDEPAAGLDTTESRELGQRLRNIIDAGITIFLVDHDMSLVLDVCDYIYVIEFGIKIAEGTPSEITRNARVIEAYLGESNQPR